MDRVLLCECGFEARAADEGRLAAEIRRHARDVHGMRLSFEEALRLASQAVSAPSKTQVRSDEEE